MKKIFVAIATMLALGTMSVVADDSFAPEAKDFSVEIQFNPFSTDFSTFKLERLQGKYMVSNKDAIRFGIGITAHSSKTKSNESYDDYSSSKYGSFSIAFGYERHFFNYKRIDLYAGVEATFAHRWAGAKSESYNSDGIWQSSYEKINYDGNGNYAGNDLGINAFTGINFSVYKGLFVGAELGLGLEHQSNDWQKTKSNYLKGNETTSKGSNKTTGFDLAFKAVPALRLGWTF